jgi:hypothetical protein
LGEEREQIIGRLLEIRRDRRFFSLGDLDNFSIFDALHGLDLVDKSE